MDQNVGSLVAAWASLQEGIEDAHGRVEIAGLVAVVGGGDPAPHEIDGRVRRREPRRELAELGGGGGGAAFDRVGGRLLERGGDAVIGLLRRQGQVPSSFLGILRGGRESPVCFSSL